jgi:hypothetical protein
LEIFILFLQPYYYLGVYIMRTFTASIIILSAEITDTKITGMAIDGDIAVKFATANNDVNRRLFVCEAQLVVTGKFRIAQEIATVGAWISGVVAVVSIPAPEAVVEPIAPAEAIEPEVVVEATIPAEAIPLTPVQKAAATRAAKKAAKLLVAS